MSEILPPERGVENQQWSTEIIDEYFKKFHEHVETFRAGITDGPMMKQLQITASAKIDLMNFKNKTQYVIKMLRFEGTEEFGIWLDEIDTDSKKKIKSASSALVFLKRNIDNDILELKYVGPLGNRILDMTQQEDNDIMKNVLNVLSHGRVDRPKRRKPRFKH